MTAFDANALHVGVFQAIDQEVDRINGARCPTVNRAAL